MAQKLRLKTAFGLEGKRTTEHEIRVLLMRDYGTDRWTMTSTIYGTTSANHEFRQELAKQRFGAQHDSAKDAKRQAEAALRRAVAAFLKVRESRLRVEHTRWIDDSD